MDANKGIDEACDLEKLTVCDLRQYLRERGAQVSGTKAELLQRATGVQSIGKRTLRELAENDALDSTLRNEQKFTTSLGEKLPEPWTIKIGWTSDSEKFPPVQESDLYNYLVLNRRRTFDSKSVKAKRQLKAKVFFEDKHVHSMTYCGIDENCSHGYVKCMVIPSLPTGSEKKKPDYDVWVCLAKISGNIHAAGCTCSAGEGESCNHVAALLCALVDVTKKKKDGLNSTTSTRCKWNMPRKRKLSPKRAEQLVFKKHKFNDAKVQRTEKRMSQEKTVQPMNVSYLVNKLKEFAPNAAFLYSDVNFLKKETSVQEQPSQHFPRLHNINFIYNTNVDLKSDTCKQHFRSYFYSLQLSEQDCAEIEKRTRGQSKNDLWFEARSGRITSSMFGSIYKQKVSTLPDNLLKSILGYSDFTSKSVQWGSSHEAAARRVYAKQIQKKHPKLRTYSVGLIVSPNFPHLGCSPDGYLECEHCDDKDGVLEIKCPYKWRFLTPYEAAKDKSFFCELRDDKVVLKRSHSYFYQVQGQMAISGRNWCDFFVWTLRGFSVERIHFEPDLWRDISAKLNQFYLNAVLPELFSLRVKHGLSEQL